ncbi:MAG: hypothetical protein C4519_15870 [Desulfobacteraceae bacterium]|nr:MAG: hypothetical protein C4519_15870 [Desulfobacteraceae bacterium]
MKERGLDDRTLFDTIRAQVLMTKVWGALVKDVKVPEKQVQVFYEAHKEDLAIGEEVRLRIIAVQSKMEAEEVLAALRKGASFRRLARSRSQGTLAAQGGDTGWVNSGTLPPALRPHVAALKTGDVSGPIQKDENEFLLIGLQGRRVLRAHSLIEARPEIERRLLPEKQREVIAAWLTDQEKKSAIEVLLQPEHVRE